MDILFIGASFCFLLMCISCTLNCVYPEEYKKTICDKLNNIEQSIAEHHAKCPLILSDTEKDISPFVMNSKLNLHYTDISPSKPKITQFRFRPYKKKLHVYQKKKFVDNL